MSLPSLADVDAIVHWPDPIVRNLKITLAYYDFEQAFIPSLGETNVRWTAFATWASRTAGIFIRGEELPDFVRAWLGNLNPATQLAARVERRANRLVRRDPTHGGMIAGLMEKIYLDVAKATADGNLRVFAELAPIFSRFITMLEASRAHDPREIANFINELRPGPVFIDGQDLLRRAFQNYYDAKYERDDTRQAQLIFLGNNQIGLHEQARLQNAIAAALNAPIADLFVGGARDAARGRIPSTLHALFDRALEFMLRPIARGIEDEWHDLATAHLMRMPLPDVTLDLGKDIPPVPGLDPFPTVLMRVLEPELLTLLGGINRAGDSLQRTAAKDWVSLLDRMNTIVNLFRSRQQHRLMYTPPFSPEQIADVRRGVMPSGRLA